MVSYDADHCHHRMFNKQHVDTLHQMDHRKRGKLGLCLRVPRVFNQARVVMLIKYTSRCDGHGQVRSDGNDLAKHVLLKVAQIGRHAGV